MRSYFHTLARYNRWANARLYEAVAALPDAARTRDLGAFFGSIHYTLNHLIVTDRIWLARIEERPTPHSRLDEVPYAAFADLHAARQDLDEHLIAVTEGLGEADIRGTLRYQSMDGTSFQTPMNLVLGHVFNHGTHHRGHVHAMLSQLGETPPALDLVYFARTLDGR